MLIGLAAPLSPYSVFIETYRPKQPLVFYSDLLISDVGGAERVEGVNI